MTSPPDALRLSPSMRGVLDQLTAPNSTLSPTQIAATLQGATHSIKDVTGLVAADSNHHATHRIAHTDDVEVLLMTWLPGHGSDPKETTGFVSVYQVLQGTAQEARYVQGADSLVDPISTHQRLQGEVETHAPDVIHALHNDHQATEPLVILQVYAPPLRDLHRFTQRTEKRPIAQVLTRQPPPQTPVVALIGGGYSGSMVAAHLVRKATQSNTPLHLVLIDRQASLSEGVAYRTADRRHLLNVPISRMSAWPDQPNDLLAWVSHRDATLGPYSFLPRRTYGEYLRSTLLDTLQQAGPRVSVELRRQDAGAVKRSGARRWQIDCGSNRAIEADALLLATGHQPPADTLKRHWQGPKTRYIENPWSLPTLDMIRSDESVCILGTGLTAIDMLQSLGGGTRSAPVLALSRRGLMPATHAPAQLAPIDPSPWLIPLLQRGALTTRALTRHIRAAVRAAETAGHNWRQALDGLRPHLSTLWQALSTPERRRFLRHVRAFWDVKRHRLAPNLGSEVVKTMHRGLLRVVAGRVISAHGEAKGVTLTIRRRGQRTDETMHFDWVINCTGPTAGTGLSASVTSLIQAGYLEEDPCGIGVHSAPNGMALANGRTSSDLAIIGPLRKADLWESIAVPELRVQAEQTADALLATLSSLSQ